MSQTDFYVHFFTDSADASKWKNCNPVVSSFPPYRYSDTCKHGNILRPILMDIPGQPKDIIELIGVDPIFDTFENNINIVLKDTSKARKRTIDVVFAIDNQNFINDSSIIEETINNISSKISDKSIVNNIRYGCIVYFSTGSKIPCFPTHKLFDAKGLIEWLKQCKSKIKKYNVDNSGIHSNLFVALDSATKLFTSKSNDNVMVLMGGKRDSSNFMNSYRQIVIRHIFEKNLNIVGLQTCTNGESNYEGFVSDMRQIVNESAKQQMDLFHVIFQNNQTYDIKLDSISDGYYVLDNAGFLGIIKFMKNVGSQTKSVVSQTQMTCMPTNIIKNDIYSLLDHAIKLRDTL